jgi:hypothetical protein
VAVEVDGQLELGPDAVVRRDQQRIAVSGGLEIEEPTESAELGIGARTGGRAGKRPDRFDQRIPGVDRNPGIGISERLLRHGHGD